MNSIEISTDEGCRSALTVTGHATMPLNPKQKNACLVFIGLFVFLHAGCGQSKDRVTSASKTPAIARVTVVKPERMTIRRVSEEPGQIEATETTPIFAKLAGYVENIAVDIGDTVKKGQVLAELRVPETLADLNQKKAMIGEAQSDKKRDEAMVEVAEAGVNTAEAKVSEIQAGIRRAEADVARWRAEASRIEQLVRERAQTGSLLDETKNKLHSAEASQDEVKAQVRSAEAALSEAKAQRDKARSDVLSAIAHIEVARFEAERAEALASYANIVAPL